MQRVLMAIGLMFLLCGFVPDPETRRFERSLPAPATEQAARAMAETWLRAQLADKKPEITTRPAVRSTLDGPGMTPTSAVWICGTLRARDWDDNLVSVVWRVRFTRDLPIRILSGELSDTGLWRFVPRDCEEFYRDGELVYR
jgi:hypothetical protein